MLTPRFHLSQDSNFVTINIEAPYTKITETEIFIEGSEFRFFSKPYFLCLTLPGVILEDGQESAKYDSTNGTYIVRVAKETPGDNFEGLDMITSLLTPKKETLGAPMIEVISSQSIEGAECECNPEDEGEEVEFDWHPVVWGDYLGNSKYGFGQLRSNVFTKLGEEMTKEIIDLCYPDSTSVQDRGSQRRENERHCFSAEHYLADLFDDDAIKCLIAFKPAWYESALLDKDTPAYHGETAVCFTGAERDLMLKLPKKEYIFTDFERSQILLGLVDLMLAFAYNHRITEGDNNVESCWNIRKLSPTLSWLDVHTSLNQVVVSFFRRTLCFPLYRHFGLASKVLEDVQHIFDCGQKQLLRNLLEIHHLFNGNDPHYVLNEIYITDYCVWIQTVKADAIKTISDGLRQIHVRKDDVGFGLTELEEMALVSAGDEDVLSVANQMSALDVSEEFEESVKLADSDDDDSVESDTTETDSDNSNSNSELSSDSNNDSAIEGLESVSAL